MHLETITFWPSNGALCSHPVCLIAPVFWSDNWIESHGRVSHATGVADHEAGPICATRGGTLRGTDLQLWRLALEG